MRCMPCKGNAGRMQPVAKVHRSAGEWLLIIVGVFDLMACVKSSGGSNPSESVVPMAENHNAKRMAGHFRVSFRSLMSSWSVKAALLSLSVWCAHPQFYALSPLHGLLTFPEAYRSFG